LNDDRKKEAGSFGTRLGS